MPRVPVPDDAAVRGSISVAGRKDHDYGDADVDLADRDHARNLTIREDAEGRYVGPPAQYADAVRAFLGHGDEPDPQAEIDAGACPWCDEYDGDAVAQHAASAHPDEWDDHKN